MKYSGVLEVLMKILLISLSTEARSYLSTNEFHQNQISKKIEGALREKKNSLPEGGVFDDTVK